MPSGGFRLDGAKEMSQKLAALAAKFPRTVARAMEEEMDIEMAESQNRTPVLTGLLKSSHQRLSATIVGNQISCVIEVTAPYAINVHENLYAFHRVGQAKFLESTLNESRRFMGSRIARRVQFGKMDFGAPVF